MDHSETAGGKSDRISIRLEPHIKTRIEQAAALDHRSLTSFIVASALEHADHVIEHNSQLTLQNEDWQVFMQALDNPPAPNEHLQKAFVNYSASGIRSDV